jgi:glyoxylase-like metal-dependent hydrolase (beta-lactamase superfamily II)/ferredoxin
MADPDKALASNVKGNFFVDSTCINCDTCRQLAPETFEDNGEFSSVYHQPQNEVEDRKARRALLACPTASIGSRNSQGLKEAVEDFPLLIAGNVYYCGFNSAKSYGGNSFFVQHPDGNWLIDSPRFVSHLVRKFEELGGLKYIFLTHRDDVGDAEQFARKFSAQRIIHELELSAAPTAEICMKGSACMDFGSDFKAIFQPGHTAGHIVLLHKNLFLFTGDHLAFDRENKRLTAFREHCWYSWSVQIESMKLLRDYQFEWILAGHGDRIHLQKEEVQQQLQYLIKRMQSPRSAVDEV